MRNTQIVILVMLASLLACAASAQSRKQGNLLGLFYSKYPKFAAREDLIERKRYNKILLVVDYLEEQKSFEHSFEVSNGTVDLLKVLDHYEGKLHFLKHDFYDRDGKGKKYDVYDDCHVVLYTPNVVIDLTVIGFGSAENNTEFEQRIIDVGVDCISPLSVIHVFWM